MKELNRIDLDLVLLTLRKLGIAFQYVGPHQPITKVGSLLHKEPLGLYYYTGTDPSIFQELSHSVVICREASVQNLRTNSAMIVELDPQEAFYRLCASLFHSALPPGIHPTAIIDPEAVIGVDVHIGPYTVVGRSTIGMGSIIHGHVVVMDGCRIGERVTIESHSCIGATGAVWMWSEQGERLILPQLGGVEIGNDVFLSAGVAIVRGLLNEDTRIGARTMIAPGSKIGHSVTIEPDCHLANNVSLAGSAYIGTGSFLGSGSSVRSHARLAPDTVVGSGAAVVKNVEQPGTTVAGVPAKELQANPKRKGVPRGSRRQD